MEVIVDSKLVRVDNLPVIGSGGEGFVVKYKDASGQPVALKIYHDPTPQRAKKLEAFFARKWNLPLGKVALPLSPVMDRQGMRIIGFTMPYLGSGFETLSELANKKSRATLGINTKRVANIFLDGHNTLKAVHANGAVSGDVSDLNELFRNDEMLWIDVDCWQFAGFPCPVATVDFVDPKLYGIDFSKAPAFRPENDWYSFAVLLFRSLLMVHPYGGQHTQYKDLMQRAQHRITVLDPTVKYPKIAFSPDMLSDSLAHEFEKIFHDGKRGEFSRALLEEYESTLTCCSSCKAWYPRNRRGCPVCNNITVVVIAKPIVDTKGVKVLQFFRTTGDIVYSKVHDGKAFVITHDKGKVILTTIDSIGNCVSKEIMTVQNGARYQIGGNILAVNPYRSDEVQLFDISPNIPVQLDSTVTEVFGPNRKAVFTATGKKVLRIVGGSIMAMEKGNFGIVERYVRSGVSDQTWFTANESSAGLQLLGLVQILNEQRYWYYLDGVNFEPQITLLEKGEALLDISVKFSSADVLLRRKTQQAGVDYIRIDVIDNQGNVIFNSKAKFDQSPSKVMHGQAYSNGTLLHATDTGLVQEKPTQNTTKTFTQTDAYVGEGDVLYKFDRGILVVSSSAVSYIQLS